MTRVSFVDAHVFIRLLLVLQVVTLAVYAVLLSAHQIPVPAFLRDVVIRNLSCLWPFLIMLVRGAAIRADRRWAWSLAGGVAAFATGNLLYVLWVVNLAAPPFPSWADAAYLSMYPFFVIAVALSMRARIGRLRASVLLDGLAAGLAAVTVGGLAVLPLARTFEGGTFEIVVAGAYPVADIAIFAMIMGVFAATGGRPGGFYGYLAAGLLLFLAADVVYAYGIAFGGYTVGTPMDVLWALAVTVLALGVSTPQVTKLVTPGVSLSSLWVVGLSSLIATLVLAWSSRLPLPLVLVLFAVATVVASTARTIIAFRQVQDLAVVRRQAMTDELTGLPNRRVLYDRIEHALSARRAGRLVGLVVLDLDRFKEVNDSLGHHAGDQVLQAVSNRLTDVLAREPSEAVLARLGGDEFAVLFPDLADLESIVVATERLQAALEEPVQLERSISVHMQASAGVAVGPEHGTTRTDLLRGADRAMYAAKRDGTGTKVFDAELAAVDLDRLRLAEDLHHALASDELTVHYQPQVDLAGNGSAVEALVRWQHPGLGLLPPSLFLPLAEDHRLMPALTRIVLGTALTDCGTTRRGGVDLQISVNLSAADLLDAGLPDFVNATLAEHDVPPRALTLEITETNVMSDPVQAFATLARFHDLGVRLSIDDYGTGHCSLAYLRQLPVQELKLDRSFVTDMVTDAKAAAIVRSSVDLAHSLGLRMVAEGVECAAAVELLEAAGCDLAQGWHFAPAMAFADLTAWLQARHDAAINDTETPVLTR